MDFSRLRGGQQVRVAKAACTGKFKVQAAFCDVVSGGGLYGRRFGIRCDFVEQAVEVFAAGAGNVFQRVAAQLRQKFGGVAHIGRFVGFAAVGHGGEEGRIGFHQQAVERAILRGGLDVFGVFEGYDAGKR